MIHILKSLYQGTTSLLHDDLRVAQHTTPSTPPRPPMIERFIATYSPEWYRKPTSQTVALGLVFCFVFTAYTTMQFYASTTYGQELASSTLSTIYFSFTMSCLASPTIVNKIGCREAMFVGVLGYAFLVLTSLMYFLYGGENVRWARRLVVSGGAVSRVC